MPAASIRSLRNGIIPVVGASRDDIVLTDVVTVSSENVHTTYAWTLAYKPPGSAAVFSGVVVNPSPGSFTVDKEGPYLVRLTADIGLVTESTQYVRLRALTVSGSLHLVAAGEGYGGSLPVPVDATSTGWADEEIGNFTSILALLAPITASGNVLFVDPTGGYGDYQTLQAAINAAVAAGASYSNQWIVLVRPGLLIEDVTFKPFVHVMGWPGNPAGVEDSRTVVIRCANGGGTATHTVALPNNSHRVILSNLTLENIVATTNATVVKTGSGYVYLHRCALLQNGLSATQGASFDLQGGMLFADSCFFVSVAAGLAHRPTFTQTGASAVDFKRCQFNGPSGLLLGSGGTLGMTCSFSDCAVSASGGAGGFGVLSDIDTLTLDYCNIRAVSTLPLLVHPAAGVYAGGQTVILRWVFLGGPVSFDVTGIVGATVLDLGSSEYTAITLPGGAPTTLAATTPATSLFYDNGASGLTAINVQDAIDEVYAYATLVRTLDDAYDGGVPASGSGRTIVADQGAIQIVDAPAPSDPPPAGNSDGNLEVVGAVRVGAISKPEIDVNPNPYGSGPAIEMGWTVVPASIPFGAGEARVQARATGNPLYRNYTLRVQTGSSEGGGTIGRVILKAGDAWSNGGATPDAGDVFIEAGHAQDVVAGDAGNIWLSPGLSDFGPAGVLYLVDPSTSTPANLTALGACANPLGVTGTITFATDQGAVTASLDAADNLAAVVAKLDALDGLAAAEALGVITITTRTVGPNAEVYYLSADVGVDAALGVFMGVAQVSGAYGSAIDLSCIGSAFYLGASGLPLIYDITTGKLTVPGIIDPTAVIFDEVATVVTAVGEGAIFVSDGTGGLVNNHLYFRAESNGAYVDLIVGSINNTLDQAYDQGGPGAGRTITADSGAVVINNAVVDATNTLELTRTGGTGAALVVGTRAAIFGDGDTVFGGVVMAGTEKFRVVGDARIEGKLTVTGLLDPTGLIVEQAAAPVTTGTQAALFVSDGSGSLTAGEIYLRKATSATPLKITSGDDAAGNLMPYHINMPEVPNDSVSYKGWCPTRCTLVAIRVCMEVINTHGNYTLAVVNEFTGNTCLSAATFNMNGLVAATVTDMVLTGTPADLVFAVGGRWVITLVSNDPTFDGEAIYIEMVFKVT